MTESKVLLIILDGWGIAENPAVSAIDAAKVPFYREVLNKYPNSTLRASEQAVGLPKGQMGNSEVGHIHLGAGRIVFQELERITNALETGDFERNPRIEHLIQYCIKNQKPLHLLGLVSDGGVHSSLEQLKGMLSVFGKHPQIPNIFIHCFTDGRDTDPRSALSYITELQAHIKQFPNTKIATLIGRYFSMDRDKRWGRIRKGYDLLHNAQGVHFEDPLEALKASYNKNITDEFIEPVVITKNNQPLTTLKEHDAVLFFNFRTDRGRQLTEALTQRHIHEYGMSKMDLYYVTLTRYDETYQNIHVVFEKEELRNTLGEVLAYHNKNQIRIAETEKYPHVTFFFNGGREEPFPNEKRILCPSPQVATYDLQPEMSAYAIRDEIISELKKQWGDFVCLNFANPDMVGHTGIFQAAVKACETVDSCAAAVVQAALQNNYTTIIIADHGNADKMLNPDGSPNTAHTLAKVPFILIQPKKTIQKVADGKLADIAPTILKLMNLPIPPEMTGTVLF